jgi:hypothetical protein
MRKKRTRRVIELGAALLTRRWVSCENRQTGTNVSLSNLRGAFQTRSELGQAVPNSIPTFSSAVSQTLRAMKGM